MPTNLRQSDNITVLNQHSVALEIKRDPASITNCPWNYIMIRHVRKTHAGDGNLYVCPYCNFYCVRKAVYKLHFSENNKPKVPFHLCHKCDFVTRRENKLKQHMRDLVHVNEFANVLLLSYTLGRNHTIVVVRTIFVYSDSVQCVAKSVNNVWKLFISCA